MLVPPHFDFSAMLTADTKVEAIAAWKFSTLNDSGTNRKTTAVPPTSSTQHQLSYEGQDELTIVSNRLEPHLSPPAARKKSVSFQLMQR